MTKYAYVLDKTGELFHNLVEVPENTLIEGGYYCLVDGREFGGELYIGQIQQLADDKDLRGLQVSGKIIKICNEAKYKVRYYRQIMEHILENMTINAFLEGADNTYFELVHRKYVKALEEFYDENNEGGIK